MTALSRLGWPACALALALLAGSVRAQAPDPKALVQRTIDRALAVLRDPSLQGLDKRTSRFEKIRVIVSEVFDWEDMSRRTLGVHWRSASEAQRARFVELFKELLAERYMEDINRFRGDEQVLVRDMHKEADDYRVDTVVITHSREEVPISYFLHAEDGSYRIHDFSIEGVSLVNHYRQSFNRFLVNDSLDALIEKLARKAPKKS